MVKQWKIIAVAILLSFCIPLKGNAFLLDFNAFYLSDGLTSSTNTSSSRSVGDFALALNLNQDATLLLGAGINSISVMDNDGTNTTEWTTLDYGLKFVGFFDSVKHWGLGLTYNLVAQGTYKTASGTAHWRGTSAIISFGYNPIIANLMYFGIRLNYYMAMYNESSTDGNNYVNESNRRSYIYPTIYYSIRFK